MTITAIILNEGQATILKGTYNNIAAIEPVPVGDGRFFLPLAVLTDPNFSEIHEVLENLPIEEIQLPEPELEPEPTMMVPKQTFTKIRKRK